MGQPGRGGTPLGVQLVRYGIAGAANTVFGLGVILALQALTPAGPYLANAGGYAAGLALSFALNRTWTFGARDRARRRAARFGAAFAVAYAANLGTLALLVGALGAAAAQAVAVGVYSVLFFALCRAFVFAPATGAGEDARSPRR